MTTMLTLFINVFLKIFMIFTPFFVMSAFLSLTKNESIGERHAGAVLFLSAVSMIQGKAAVSPQDSEEDVAVVPLAIPITVGPGTIGALLVMGADLETFSEKAVASLALVAAVLSVGGLLLVAGRMERLLGQQGLSILTKLTGLFVSAIAAQIFFTGLKNFLG
jgi:multiple antibiotic resistance protein